MRFSIVIPIYNVEEYIAECLNSILCSFDNNKFEIICVDDASKDGSVQIIKNYQSKYSNIHLYENEINKGASYSRNKGIEMAKGEYIWFVDSDDIISSDALTILDNEINMKLTDVICFNANIFGPSFSGSFISEKYKSTLEGLNHERKNIGPFFLVTNLWVCCIKREFIERNNIRFPDNLTIFEDWVFLWKLTSCLPNIKYINATLYHYRVVVKNSLTKSYRENKEEISIFDVWNEMKEYLLKKEIFFRYEQFCLIRANDIFFHFLNHRRHSFSSYKKYCINYSRFLKGIHSDLFRYIINDYSKEDRKVFRTIRENPKKMFRLYIWRKSRVDSSFIKLKEHIKLFLIPIMKFIKWGRNVIFIFYYLVKILGSFLINIHLIIRSLYL